MKKFNIANAREDQMLDVARIFTSSRKAAMPDLPRLHTEEEDQHYFTKVVFKNTYVCLAVDAETDKVLGFISFKGQVIYHLYVDQEEQGQGLGSMLLKFVQDNSPILQLWVFQRNTKAIEFYKKRGFKIERETDGSDNEEKEPDVLLTWKP